MKRIFLFTVSIVVLFCVSFSAYSEEYDFRKTRWGMSREEVKKAETRKLFGEDEQGIIYIDRVLNRNVFVHYRFVKERLHDGGYIVSEKYNNLNIYIKDFNEFKKALTKKYGKPTQDEVVWSNSLYKNNQEKLGYAVKSGHVQFGVIWQKIKTHIALILMGHEDQINLSIMYTSPPHFDFKEEFDSMKEDKL